MSNSIMFWGAGETLSLGSSWKLNLESMPSGSGTALPETQELLWQKEKGARVALTQGYSKGWQMGPSRGCFGAARARFLPSLRNSFAFGVILQVKSC